MVRVLALLAFLLPVFAVEAGPAQAQGISTAPPQNQVEMVLFYGRGCPHCAAMRQYLDDIRPAFPELRIHEYEVYFDADNAQLFERMSAAYDREVSGVPTAFLGDQVIVGYAEEIAPQITAMIEACIDEQCPSPLARLAGTPPEATTLTLPAVLFAAAVDAINPCAFAVLILLITGVLAARDRRRALYAGLAFSLSIFISYYAMGVGLYSAIEASGVTRALFAAVAVLAVLIGLFNLKDVLWYGKWFVMEVPRSWRPTMNRFIRGITSVPGAFLIGFLISLFLLPCTSGPYIVILGLLATTATQTSALVWLLLYNAIFILPMIAITLAVYAGLTTVERAETWRSGHLKLLHLIAGTIMLVLGVGMLGSLWFGWV